MKLTELYYAGSHGMDIMGPVNKSESSGHHVECVTSTDSEVKQHFDFVPTHFVPMFHNFNCSIVFSQGKEVNLFQPASEFLPMIAEVCIDV